MEYHEIEKLPAEAFLNPNNFTTDWDKMSPGYAEEQYQTGLKYGKECSKITISERGVWGGTLKNGGYLSSYEGIGYHSCTSHLLKGFLDSGVEIHVYRRVNDKVTCTKIK
jgi:hypothetical protein